MKINVTCESFGSEFSLFVQVISLTYQWFYCDHIDS